MKTLNLKHLGSSLVLIAGMSAYGLANAHGDEHHEAAPAAKADAAHTESAEQKIPETSEGIWQAIDQQTAELDKVIQSGALDEVHHHAFAIRDLVAALPARSQTLAADKLVKVKGNVKFVATLAERLDSTGDAKDKPGTVANLEKLKKVLEGTRAIYAAPKAS